MCIVTREGATFAHISSSMVNLGVGMPVTPNGGRSGIGGLNVFSNRQEPCPFPILKSTSRVQP
jgi:hypothetical protein